MQYNQNGNYIVFAGLIVGVLSRFGVIVNETDATSIISVAMIIVGIVKQFIAHRKLAVIAGAIKP